MRCSEPGLMALLGICHRTIHTVQRPQNKVFLLRKPLPAVPASFGDQLRLSRLSHGYTQHEIACAFGVSLSAVKFWEQNRHEPNQAVRAQVEAFLNTAPLANSSKPQHVTFIGGCVGNLPSAELTKNDISQPEH
ncbi:MAG TPA: helix-turn-helix transcriptional regulator [Methylomirabilota bacterium]|nr:helix-turn-helix transcriptional regulator [Methylomirabilota bacterium]